MKIKNTPINNTQYLILTTITFILGGCATPAELRQNTPNLELKSTNNSKHVAACIADKWENSLPLLGTQPINMKIKKDGYSVAHGNEETIHLSDIKDSPNGGSVTFYYKHRNSLVDVWTPAVISCQND